MILPVNSVGALILMVAFPLSGVTVILTSPGPISILLTVKFPSVFNMNTSLYIGSFVILMPVRLCLPGVNIIVLVPVPSVTAIV